MHVAPAPWRPNGRRKPLIYMGSKLSRTTDSSPGGGAFRRPPAAARGRPSRAARVSDAHLRCMSRARGGAVLEVATGRSSSLWQAATRG